MVASKSGVVGLMLHAVDGTKIASQVSSRTGWHKKALEKLLREVDESIDEMMAQVDSAEATQEGEYRLPEELQDATRRREQIEQALSELEQMGSEHAHPADPDAQMMKCKEGIKFAYNAQAVVDEQSGLIVAEEVLSEPNDTNQLEPMIRRVEENGVAAAQQTVADGGYWSPEQLAEAERSEHEVLVSVPPQVDGRRQGDGEFHKSRFRYDGQKDVFICPLGKELTYERTKKGRRHKEKQVRVYRCRCHRQCPARSRCSAQGRGRTIEKGRYYESVVRQVEKQRDEEKKRQLKKRKEVAEIAFAWIKHHMGFRRWTVRGIEKVRTQWAMLCGAVNLRKLYKLWLKGKLAWA